MVHWSNHSLTSQYHEKHHRTRHYEVTTNNKCLKSKLIQKIQKITTYYSGMLPVHQKTNNVMKSADALSMINSCNLDFHSLYYVEYQTTILHQITTNKGCTSENQKLIHSIENLFFTWMCHKFEATSLKTHNIQGRIKRKKI